jgi:(2Fe-2S) ferredoxin
VHPNHDTYIFICGHTRDEKKACGSEKTDEIVHHLHELIKQNKPHFQVKVKAHKTGCLGYCSIGPNLVIFPENIWYHFENINDINEIFEQHIMQGKKVTRLLNK